jgi:hypothetical protein
MKYGLTAKLVMPGLAAYVEASARRSLVATSKPWRRRVPGIYVLLHSSSKDVDGRDKPGHDEKGTRFQTVRKSLKMLAAPMSENEGSSAFMSRSDYVRMCRSAHPANLPIEFSEAQ